MEPMTFDAEPEADDETEYRAQRLHEFAVNQLSFDTEDVLFTAKADGTVQGRVEPEGGRR